MREKRWHTLDNTANVFPVIAGENLTNTYRLSAVLKEAIDPLVLQKAVDIVTPRFPGFDVRLRRGVFWYYLEENGKKPPRVREENMYPCRLIHATKNNSYLFRVTYYRNRINLSVFHALADGFGGFNFMKELVYQYLRLAHSELAEKKKDRLAAGTSLNMEDSFLAHYRKGNKSAYKLLRSFHLSGRRLPQGGFGVMHGLMDVAEIKQVARQKYGCSINDYLVSCMVWAIYKANRSRVTGRRPVRCAVPVNLRPYFNSNTTNNFFVMISAEVGPDTLGQEEITFEELTASVRDQLASQLDKDHLEQIFSYNVSNEKILAARAVPLPLKNIAIKYVYYKNADANTTTVTNVGEIKLEPEYEPYVDMFTAYLAFSRGQELKGSICSYKGRLAYSISSGFEDTIVPRILFRQIAADGIDVEIETNGVWY